MKFFNVNQIYNLSKAYYVTDYVQNKSKISTPISVQDIIKIQITIDPKESVDKFINIILGIFISVFTLIILLITMYFCYKKLKNKQVIQIKKVEEKKQIEDKSCFQHKVDTISNEKYNSQEIQVEIIEGDKIQNDYKNVEIK